MHPGALFYNGEMITKSLSLVFLLGLFVLEPLWAEDPAVASALNQVQQMLTTPGLRNAEAQKTQAGREATQKLEGLGGSAQTNEEIYALAAEIFAQMVRDTGGDGDKLKAKVAEAQKNPEAFASSWNSQQREKLKSLTTKMPMN